jgi:CHAT domain-containing protein
LLRLSSFLLCALSPVAHAATLQQVELLSEQRRLGEAEAQLATLRGQVEPAAVDLEAARIVLRRGQYVLAEQGMLQWFEDHGARYFETAPLKLRATIVLAQSRFEQGDFVQAEAALRSIDTHEATINAERAYALAAVLIARGQADEARAQLLPALAQLADSSPLLRAQLLSYLAYAELLSGDVDATGRAIEETLALRQQYAPGSVSEGIAHYFLSYVQAERGQYQAADQSLMSAIALLEAERARQSSDGEIQSLWAAQFAFFYREAIRRAADRGDLKAALALAQRMRRAPTEMAPLDEQTLLLSYVVHDRRSFLLSSFRGELRVVDLGLSHAELSDAVEAALMLIAAREHADRSALEARLAVLYQQLVAPAWREGASKVYVQTDGPLHALPFGALIVNASSLRYLIEDVSILRADRLPSSDAERESSSAPPMWIVANPSAASEQSWLRASSGRLVGATQEAQAVAALYPNAKLLLGDEASERALHALPPEADLHIAAHMLRHPSDEQRSLIALAAGAGDDGVLRDDEVARFAGRRDLVVLSGCASLRGSFASEGPLSMAQAWHRAGARHVIATLWPVPDASTAHLMLAFHRHRIESRDVLSALAQAQRDWLSEHRNPSFGTRLRAWWQRSDTQDLSLPFYWAAAVVSQ